MSFIEKVKSVFEPLGLKIGGPLISWSAMFVIGITIKAVSFDDNTVWFEIAPEAALWATGVFFTIAIADDIFSRAKLLPKYKRKETGLGYEIDYDITLPESYDLSSQTKYFYIFLISLVAWIINIFLSGFALEASSSSTPGGVAITLTPLSIFLFAISIAIAGGMVVLAIRALGEISK